MHMLQQALKYSEIVIISVGDDVHLDTNGAYIVYSLAMKIMKQV